jgi:hypothetical protein
MTWSVHTSQQYKYPIISYFNFPLFPIYTTTILRCCSWEAFFSVSSGWYLFAQMQIRITTTILRCCSWAAFFSASRSKFSVACYAHLYLMFITLCFLLALFEPVTGGFCALKTIFWCCSWKAFFSASRPS